MYVADIVQMFRKDDERIPCTQAIGILHEAVKRTGMAVVPGRRDILSAGGKLVGDSLVHSTKKLNPKRILINASGAASQRHEFAAHFTDWKCVLAALDSPDSIVPRGTGAGVSGTALLFKRGTP